MRTKKKASCTICSGSATRALSMGCFTGRFSSYMNWDRARALTRKSYWCILQVGTQRIQTHMTDMDVDRVDMGGSHEDMEEMLYEHT
jgi:hypothetical protein